MRKLLNNVLINREISLLFSGQVISQIGDSMFNIGLLWLVLDLTGSKALMGTVAMTAYLPVLIFGIFGGIVVDTVDRRHLMIIADLLRALFVLAIPVAMIMGGINLVIIFTVTFCLATCSTVFNPARDSLIPDLVGKEELLKVNSVMQVSAYGAMTIGCALGAPLIGFFGLTHLFTIDGLTFLISMIAIWKMRPPQRVRVQENTLSIKGHFSDILTYIRAHKRLKWLLLLTSINNFFIMGIAVVGTPVFVKEVLNKGAASFALVETCLGMGMVAGCFLVNYMGKTINKGRLLLLGMIFDGLTYTLAGWCNSLGIFMLLIIFHAIGIPFIVVSRTSLIQEWVPKKRLGKVFSLVNITVVGMIAFAAGSTGFLAELMGVKIIFIVFGSIATICGLIGWLYAPLRDS